MTRIKGWNLVLGLGLLLCAALACKFNASTANISSLKVAKDKAATQEASSFGANDTIYAVAEVSNVPDKVKVKGRLSFEDVEGQPPARQQQDAGQRKDRQDLRELHHRCRPRRVAHRHSPLAAAPATRTSATTAAVARSTGSS